MGETILFIAVVGTSGQSKVGSTFLVPQGKWWPELSLLLIFTPLTQ